MKSYRKIICEICGKQAEIANTRRLDYCDNPECGDKMRKIKRKEIRERFNAKHQIAKQDERIIKVAKPWQAPATRVVNTKAAENLDISDIRELARQLGTIRFTLIQMIEKERTKIESCHKEDDTLIHAFEFENLTKEEVWEKYLQTQERRTKRREDKYRYAIIKGMLDAIKIKNPDKYVVQAINGCKTTRDFEKYMDELKQDRELFIV